VLGLEVARNAAGKMRRGGTLLLMGGTGGRRISRDGLASAATAALPPFVATLALNLAPVRVNLIAAGFVDTPLSASYFSPEGLDARREELRRTLSIGRVVGPADVAALAVHIMANTAPTGATYDIDGGQQFVS
jgi:NAD(P)-dependent dehydrogenase (short-subunit alcohol dehydrogenase family)